MSQIVSNNPFSFREIEKQYQSIDIGPGIYYDLSNEQYHKSPGISKSGLDMVAKSPSVYKWYLDAPRDELKTGALDFGTALHCLLLEPDEFDKRFVVSPEFNRRTVIGRDDEQLFITECDQSGITIIQSDDMKKLSIMRDSVMAHPVGRFIFEQSGTNEASIYWNDDETGELCRVRPDRLIDLHGRPIIVDVKKIDGIDRFKRHVFEFRYHVQAAMYREGYQAHFGQLPDFWFLVASSSISAGRYEVDVIQLPAETLAEGAEKFRSDLNIYSRCRKTDDWLHISTI